MEIVYSHIQHHYKKLLFFCTVTATAAYLIKRFVDKKRRSKQTKTEKKTIKDFPTIQEIQRFIEELPFEAVNSGKAVTLKDLLGELSEFSEDEDWKELIASVHHMYKDNAGPNKDDNASIGRIYEDPNVITLTPRKKKSPKSEENRGNGDAEVGDDKNDENIEILAKNLGEGDTKEL